MAERQQDEYKPLGFYKKHSTQKKSGFSKFEVDGEYFFCRHVDDEICLLSQSYVSASGRDNGIESVKKNSKLAKRYRFDSRGGNKQGFSLIAGNHQEIAISPDYTSKKKAEFVAGRMRGSVKSETSGEASKIKAPVTKAPAQKTANKATAAGATLAAAGVAAAKASKVEDDYKPLAFYERQTEGRDHGIETFKGDDGEHYFAYFENGKIALISEGYPTVSARDNGAASVEKNIGLEERYQYRGPLKNGKYDFKLKAGNGKEIARSVWYSSAAAAATGAAYLIGTRKRAAAVVPATTAVPTAVAGAPIAAAALATTAAGSASAETPDMAPVTKAAPVAETAAPSSAEEYYENEGGGIWRWLKLLLLALLMLLALFFLLKACAGSDKDANIVPTANVEPALVACWDGSEAKDEMACPTKVTCWDGSFVTSQDNCPVETSALECPDGSIVETLDMCPMDEEPETVVETPAVEIETPVEPEPIVEPAPVMEPEVVQSTRNALSATLGAASIFAPGGAEAVMVTRLGTNPEFGDSHSLTPSGFYDKLAFQYDTNEYDRNYLDFLFRELGYAGGFKDVTAAAFSNTTVSNGSRGILGYGSVHGYQYSELNVIDSKDLEAFRVQSLNGKDIHFMKSCGNYFYITG